MTLPEKVSIDSGDDHASTDLPLLGADNACSDDLSYMRASRRPRSRWPFVLHFVAFVVYSLAYFGMLLPARQPALYYNPLESSVQYQKVTFNGSLDATNVFKGEPRPELDEAWEGLIDNLNVRLSDKDIKTLNVTAAQLYDKSGYFGMIGVFHHLHCLKYIRQVVYDDHYHVDEFNRQMHIDHCIDELRQALMCYPDLSVIPFDWKADRRHPQPQFEVEKTCVDWKSLDEGASRISFEIWDQKSLVHPQFGIAYPVINGEREFINTGPEMHIVWPEDHEA